MSVRAYIHSAPLRSSATPGSCRPLPERAKEACTLPGSSRQVRPSSSEHRQRHSPYVLNSRPLGPIEA